MVESGIFVVTRFGDSLVNTSANVFEVIPLHGIANIHVIFPKAGKTFEEFLGEEKILVTKSVFRCVFRTLPNIYGRVFVKMVIRKNP